MEKNTTIMWEKYYEDLPIPSDWENVSYGNDELPSFSCNGYQIWINHPTLEGRQENYLGIGHKDLSKYEDWRFFVTYQFDYGEVTNDLLYTMLFNEVVNFVNKPDMYAIKQLLDHHTNYKLNIKEWQDYEVRKFIKDFPKEVLIAFLREQG